MTQNLIKNEKRLFDYLVQVADERALVEQLISLSLMAWYLFWHHVISSYGVLAALLSVHSGYLAFTFRPRRGTAPGADLFHITSRKNLEGILAKRAIWGNADGRVYFVDDAANDALGHFWRKEDSKVILILSGARKDISTFVRLSGRRYSRDRWKGNQGEYRTVDIGDIHLEGEPEFISDSVVRFSGWKFKKHTGKMLAFGLVRSFCARWFLGLEFLYLVVGFVVGLTYLFPSIQMADVYIFVARIGILAVIVLIFWLAIQHEVTARMRSNT